MKPWIRTVGEISVALAILGGLVGVAILAKSDGKSQDVAGDVWTCSMHPQVRLPKSEPCPLCGMKLIPLSQLKTEQSETEERANIETEVVTFRELFKDIRTVGKLDYNERRVKNISARIAGRIDRVYADFTGIEVKQNDHLVEIYSPALVTAQSELLRALESAESATGDRRFAKLTLDAARTKLRLLGILPEQLAELEKNRTEHTQLIIYAPRSGTIIEKMVREGMYVQEGDPLYRIAELDPLWLYLDVYEADLGWVRLAQRVEVRVEAYPGEVFSGTVVFIDPFLNDQSRTVKVRVNLKNPERRLKPAMYASAMIRVRLQADGTPEPTGLEGKYLCPMHPEIIKDELGHCELCEMDLERVPAGAKLARGAIPIEPEVDAPPGKVLALRASAVLDTGRRQIAYRKNSDGAFELVDVVLGPQAEATDEQGRNATYFPVLKGLRPDDRVAIRGGFMLDSQRQIEGMPSLLYPTGQSAANLHTGHGGHSPASLPSSPSPAPPVHKH